MEVCMTLEEIKAALEAAGKQDVYEDVVGLVNSEREKGIAESRKRNNENARLRKFKQAFETLGYTDDTDLEDFVASVGSSKGPTNNLTLKLLNDKIKSMESELQGERRKSKTSKIVSELTKALNDKVYGAQFLIRTLLADDKVDLADDQVVFKDGDTVLDFNTGINKILETNKEIVKANQNPGTGTKVVTKATTNNVQAILATKDPVRIASHSKEIADALGLKM